MNDNFDKIINKVFNEANPLFRNLTEDRFDSIELAYVQGKHNLIKDYNQGLFLKKILNGKTYDHLYRFLMNFSEYRADSPMNPANWKVGDRIPMELMSTSKVNDWAAVKQAFGFGRCKYVLVFSDVKGYEINYSSEEYKKFSYSWQKFKTEIEPAYSAAFRKQEEVLTAGLFEVENIETLRGKSTVTLKTIDQSKEFFMKMLQNIRQTRKDNPEQKRNGIYGYAPSVDGDEGSTWRAYKRVVKDIDQTYFHIDNLSDEELQFLNSVPDLLHTDKVSKIFEFATIVDRVPAGATLKDFENLLWNVFHNAVTLDSNIKTYSNCIDLDYYKGVRKKASEERYKGKSTKISGGWNYFERLADTYNSIMHAKEEYAFRQKHPSEKLY